VRWLTISLFAYVATVFAVGVPWLTVAHNLVVPHIQLSGDYLAIVVAVLGTTISPYLFFWAATEEVKDVVEPSSISLRMGEFALTNVLTVLGWLATAVMGAAAFGMFATWGQ
jgi:Mn2+/Fe2+ NRAMP family transporter